MSTLGIDPATTTGLAIVDGPRLLYSGTLRSKPGDLMPKHDAVRRLFAQYGWDQATIEGQWIGDTSTPEGRSKAQGALLVRDAAAMWRAALQLVTTIDPVVVQPGAWRSLVFARKAPTGRAACKEAALRFCQRRGWAVESVDAAEAACIAASLEWRQKKATTPLK